MRHYFSLDNRGRRYACVDVKNSKLVHRPVKMEDPGREALPGECKIRFTGTVQMETSESESEEQVIRLLHGEPFTRPRPFSSAFVYAHLARDYFCFDFPSDQRYGKDWFRFVRNPITESRKANLPDDHWIFGVRKLVLYIPEKDIQVSEWDRTVLAGMKLLESVYLVIPEREAARSWFVNRKLFLWDHSRTMYRDPLRMFKFEEEHHELERWFMQMYARVTKKNLCDVLSRVGINLRVRIAVESIREDGWITHYFLYQ
ncbi:hypothetical protein GGR53DRAFT_531874, partial [Hypoxylon sp. FL1150]